MQPATATVLPLRPAADDQSFPLLPTTEPDIAQFLLQVLFRPRAVDRLDVSPATVIRPRRACRPVVIVDLDDTPLIVSADAARRIACTLDAGGRRGAALDLIQGADDAEALSHDLEARTGRAAREAVH